MRLIDADELKAAYIPSEIEGFEKMMVPVEVVLQNIDDMPTVEAVPVVHGRWETVEDWDGDEHYQCSECKAEYVLIDGDPDDNDYLYCPHCGARMDERDGGDNG